MMDKATQLLNPMKVQDDMEVNKPDTATRILDVAERLFVEHGFEATSLRMITQQAEVNLAAVNYHFGSKDALFESVLAAIAQALAVSGSIEQLVQNETHIAQWRLIAHTRPSCTSLNRLLSLASRSISAAGCQCAPKRSASCSSLLTG